MKIGLMTGGGDAPGLNGILESTGRCLITAGVEILGIEDGFEGIFENKTRPLTIKDIQYIHSQAGTLLGTSNKCATKNREAEFLEKYKKLNLDGLVVAGGDGTFSGLKAFSKDIPIIGVPKTIDNDLSGTEITFGFDTACSVVANAVDSLRATANAHKRVIIVEAMGRTAGWIALGGGLAAYADAILIPERPYSRKDFLNFLKQKKDSGTKGLLVVISEGASALNEKASVAFQVKDSPEAKRLGGVSFALARWIEEEIGWETRNVVLGHLQRAEHPTTTDRFLTLAMGVEVSRMIKEKAWQQAVVYRKGQIERAPIQDLMGPPRLVSPEHHWVKYAQALGIFV